MVKKQWGEIVQFVDVHAGSLVKTQDTPLHFPQAENFACILVFPLPHEDRLSSWGPVRICRGERCERRRGRIKRAERVAAVGEGRRLSRRGHSPGTATGAHRAPAKHMSLRGAKRHGNPFPITAPQKKRTASHIAHDVRSSE